MPSTPSGGTPQGGTPPATETLAPSDRWPCDRYQCVAEATEFVFGVGRPKRFCRKHFLIFHRQRLALWDRQKVRAAIRAAKKRNK